MTNIMPAPGSPDGNGSDLARAIRELADRTVAAENAAADARFRLARLRARRGVKVALAVAEVAAHPRRWRRLAGLRTDLAKSSLPPPPTPRSSDDVLNGLAVRDRLVSRSHGGRPYAHFLTLVAGSPRFEQFVGVHRVNFEYLDWYFEQLPDLVLIDVSAPDPALPTLIERALNQDVPVVVDVGGGPQPAWARGCQVVSTNPIDGALVLPPGVDPQVDNPIGQAGGNLPGPDEVPQVGEGNLPASLVVRAGIDTTAAESLRAVARGSFVLGPGSEPGDLPGVLAPDDIDWMVENRIPVEQQAVIARREVFWAHTERHRFESIVRCVGLPVLPPPLVTVLLCTNRPESVVHGLESVSKQDYPRLEVVLVLHGTGFDIKQISDQLDALPMAGHVVEAASEVPFGEALNAGLDRAAGTLVTKFDDDDWYGSAHIRDLVIAREYSGADVVGKWSNFAYLADKDQTVGYHPERQEVWADHLPGATILGSTQAWQSLRFRRLARAVDTDLLSRIRAEGGRLYSTHRYGFVRHRHADHTFRQDDRYFIERAGREVWDGQRLDLALVT